ncbi:MAG: metallophosphoesterase, partial [Oscillospiraceae bacterium]|nr:metallophosphoesterase [Oscillospiraceae bacterium]
MKKKKVLCLLVLVILISGLLLSASAQTKSQEVTILFTHDLHSHLLPDVDQSGASFGGFARLKTLVDECKGEYPDAVLVDAGDFSMGTLYQTVYSEHALELRSLGALGCDVTTLGNHEFDYRPQGLAQMLNSAVASNEKLPQIVLANYRTPANGEEGYNEDTQAVADALEAYGAESKYTVIERGGVNFAFFGIFGVDA